MKRFILLLSTAFILSLGWAQKSADIEKARLAFSEFDYEKTAQILANAQNLETQDLRRLAYSYFYLGQYDNALQTLDELIKRPDHNYNDTWTYIKTLRITRQYDKSVQMCKQLLKEHPGDIRASLVLDDTAYYQKLDRNIAVIQNLDFNSANQDFAPVIFNGKIIFTSTRMIGKQRVLLWPGNNKPFFDLLIADFDPQTLKISKIKPLNINSVLNEANATLTGDGQTMIYSANYTQPGSNGKFNLRLIQASYQNGKWQDIGTLPFCSPDYSTTHPFITPDGSMLFFASDRPGGYGGMDIYVAFRQADGSWSAPQNLGNNVNTEGNEVYPYFDGKYLFFASDGRPGLGGLDIFISKIIDNSPIYTLNLGEPINSPDDDFAIFFGQNSSWALFSSNRSGGKGSDDIYKATFPDGLAKLDKTVLYLTLQDTYGNQLDNITLETGENTITTNSTPVLLLDKNSQYRLNASKQFYLPAQANVKTGNSDRLYLTMTLTPLAVVSGTVTGKLTGNPLPGATVSIQTPDTVLNTVTDQNGYYSVNVPLNNTAPVTITFSAPNYAQQQTALTLPQGFAGDTSVNARLTPASSMITLVFFDFDKAKITNDQARKLDRLVNYLSENPQMSVLIAGHTDCRGSAVYNKFLSQRRAKAVFRYITRNQNLQNLDITSQGFGEEQPFVVDRQTHLQYPFLPEGQILSEQFIASLTPGQQKIAHRLNRRVEITLKLKD